MQALVNQKSEERVRQAEEMARGMLTYTDIMAYESREFGTYAPKFDFFV